MLKHRVIHSTQTVCQAMFKKQENLSPENGRGDYFAGSWRPVKEKVGKLPARNEPRQDANDLIMGDKIFKR